jgi:hypothetical protein
MVEAHDCPMVEAHDCPMVEAWGMVVGGIPKQKVCHESSLVQEPRGAY